MPNNIKITKIKTDNDSDIGSLCCCFAARNFLASYFKIAFSTMITNFDKLCGDLEKQELEVVRLRLILTLILIIGYVSYSCIYM